MTLNIVAILEEHAVLGGRLASLPKSKSIRNAFAKAAEQLCQKLQEHDFVLTPVEQLALVIKLASYTAKRQWNIDSIATKATSFLAPQLQIAQCISAGLVASFEVPELHKV